MSCNGKSRCGEAKTPEGVGAAATPGARQTGVVISLDLSDLLWQVVSGALGTDKLLASQRTGPMHFAVGDDLHATGHAVQRSGQAVGRDTPLAFELHAADEPQTPTVVYVGDVELARRQAIGGLQAALPFGVAVSGAAIAHALNGLVREWWADGRPPRVPWLEEALQGMVEQLGSGIAPRQVYLPVVNLVLCGEVAAQGIALGPEVRLLSPEAARDEVREQLARVMRKSPNPPETQAAKLDQTAALFDSLGNASVLRIGIEAEPHAASELAFLLGNHALNCLRLAIGILGLWGQRPWFGFPGQVSRGALWDVTVQTDQVINEHGAIFGYLSPFEITADMIAALERAGVPRLLGQLFQEPQTEAMRNLNAALHWCGKALVHDDHEAALIFSLMSLQALFARDGLADAEGAAEGVARMLGRDEKHAELLRQNVASMFLARDSLNLSAPQLLQGNFHIAAAELAVHSIVAVSRSADVAAAGPPVAGEEEPSP